MEGALEGKTRDRVLRRQPHSYPDERLWVPNEGAVLGMERKQQVAGTKNSGYMVELERVELNKSNCGKELC